MTNFPILGTQKKKHAMLSWLGIQTGFHFIEADEKRVVNDNHTKALQIQKRIAITSGNGLLIAKRIAQPSLKAWAVGKNDCALLASFSHYLAERQCQSRVRNSVKA